MSRRKPPKGGRAAASKVRSPVGRRRKGRSGKGLLLVALAVALFALGALFGERILQRFNAWRAPAPPPEVSAGKKVRPESSAKPARPKPARTTPAPEKASSPAESTVGVDAATDSVPTKARVALVIDDLGRDVAAVEALAAIAPAAANVQLSYAVLPFESRTSEVVEALRRHGAEILLHLPMDPEGKSDPGPGALLSGMSKRDLAAATAAALAAVPGAQGVNNHMGSKLSSDREAMAAILGEVRREGRYFLDSRTSADSVGFEVARELAIPAASRDLFLDDDPTRQAIESQFAALLAFAREHGAAIAIAHPRPETLAVLREAIPRAVAAGFEFVPVSYLLERSEEFPE